MPYLHVHVNIEVDDRAGLLAACSRAVAEALGKPERYVMVELSAGKPMLFAGSDAPAAFLQLASLGLPDDVTGGLSEVLCGLIERELGIPPTRVYIEFSSPPRHMWGWDRRTFAG
ncbi:MAG: phenylpyruvate tautomerase MIF-related protein [Mariprofundaceae bacterium]